MADQRLEIEWKGRTGPFPLILGPGVFSPTATSKTLAEVIDRSFRSVVYLRESARLMYGRMFDLQADQ